MSGETGSGMDALQYEEPPPRRESCLGGKQDSILDGVRREVGRREAG